MGVDYLMKIIDWNPCTMIRFQLWDIAGNYLNCSSNYFFKCWFVGQARSGKLSRAFYKDANGAIIVFDLTRINTFESVPQWKTQLDTKLKKCSNFYLSTILLGNKVRKKYRRSICIISV